MPQPLILAALFFLSACASSGLESNQFSAEKRSLHTRKAISVCTVKKGKRIYYGFGEDLIEARNMARNACELYQSGCTDEIHCEDRSGSELICGVAVSDSERTRIFGGVGRSLKEASRTALSSCRENIGKNACAKIMERTCTHPNPTDSPQPF